MNIMHRLPVLALALPAVWLLPAGRHPTPTVTLVKKADVIRQALPGARQFFLRSVTIGKRDLETLRREADFTPENPAVEFYVGKDAGGEAAGVVLFPQVNSTHGPIEVGLAIGPDGAISSATVTKATVETKPWVKQALEAGLMKGFRGIRQPGDANQALDGVSGLRPMPRFMAELITAAVGRGLVLYRTLYQAPVAPVEALAR
jgi:hypothetical protein